VESKGDGMKIAFHDNSLCLFGTTVAIFNWAYWGREYMGFEPIFLFNQTNKANNESVIQKFKDVFSDKVFGYTMKSEIDGILSSNGCEYFLMEKGGKPDGVISTVSKNLVNAIGVCGKQDIHGDVYAMGSKWLSSLTNYEIPYVPYIVHMERHENNLRDVLGIPQDAFVFGRNGGYETFDLDFVKQAIREVIDERSDMWFVFQCTVPFMTHERVIYLPSSTDTDYKVKFINTCDAMLHARHIGESFGMACAEFSYMNKPVITWAGSTERNHIDTLGDNGIYYQTKDDVIDILLGIKKSDVEGRDWNCYSECAPYRVMEKFKNVYMRG
jgi:hypothetical protein